MDTNTDTNTVTNTDMDSISTPYTITLSSLSSSNQEPTTTPIRFMQIHDQDVGVIQIDMESIVSTLVRLYMPTAGSNQIHDMLTFVSFEHPENVMIEGQELHIDTNIGVESDMNLVCKQITENVAEDDICAICMDPLEFFVTEERVSILCNHKFCKPCITAWFAKHKTCPLCMKNMDELIKN